MLTIVLCILLATLLVTFYYFHYYTKHVVSAPILYGASDAKFGKFLREHCPVLRELYRPPIWAVHTMFMTLGGGLLRSLVAPKLKYFREYILTPDGGQLSLDWFDPHSLGPRTARPNATVPICVFIPGLTGTSQEEYIRMMLPVASQIGYRTVVVNHRGLADTELLTPRLYCSVSDDDLQVALQCIRERNPNVKILAVGFSLGGNILTRHLWRSDRKSLVDAAFLVSCCFNYTKADVNRRLTSGFWPQILNFLLTQWLVSTVLKHKKVFQELQFDLNSFRLFTSLKQFDCAFVAKIFGFSSPEEYYREASNENGLINIRVPTLALAAGDDVIAPEEDLPREVAMKCKRFQLLVTGRGGHLGFLEGPWWPRFYTERVFEQYAKAIWLMEGNPIDLL